MPDENKHEDHEVLKLKKKIESTSTYIRLFEERLDIASREVALYTKAISDANEDVKLFEGWLRDELNKKD